LKEDNEIRLIEVQEERNEINCLNVFPHSHEIWSLSPSPSDPALLFTVYNSIVAGSSAFQTSLWKMNEETNGLEEILELPGHIGTIKNVLWNPSGTRDSVISIDDHHVRLWKLGESSTQTQVESTINVGEVYTLTAGCWNPHFLEQIATINDCSVRGWDLRSSKQSFVIENAHSHFVRDIDFNRNRIYFFATGGDDGRVRFWDYRKLDGPVKEFSDHSHWVWNVKYNPSYDQLVVSSSTDCHVNLYNVVSVSASPASDEFTSFSGKEDSLIKIFAEHEESVYSVAWSPTGWLFASLSYDGRVVVNQVPKEEREKIIFA